MFKRLLDLREEKQLNQVTVASMLHVHQTTYSDYETGKIDIPVEALIRLADYYGTSLDYLVGRTAVRVPYPSQIK